MTDCLIFPPIPMLPKLEKKINSGNDSKNRNKSRKNQNEIYGNLEKIRGRKPNLENEISLL